MARNEEKLQGRLNRLWLQREREGGRLRDAAERRPKLSTLNSASSVRKWLPSINSEIEYYLQQSQLPHYPERKIAEFQLHIEALERQYKSFIAKLRALDPSCKRQPWTPRAYCKRRAETPNCPSAVKKPWCCRSQEDSGQCSSADSDLTSSWTGCDRGSATQEKGALSHSSIRFLSNPLSETPAAACGDQDKPLSFDPTQLAVASAAFRGQTPRFVSSQTQSLARVLHSGLPNLRNSSSGQVSTMSRGRSRGTEDDDGAMVGLVTVQEGDVPLCKLKGERAERKPETSLNSSTTEEKTANVLGLDCYSSSEDSEDCHS